jgi:DNA recombination protein RmuC
MGQTMNAVAAFIIQYARELAAGFAILLVLTALILLIILIRRKPEDMITKLQDIMIDLANKQERLENVVKDEITLNRQETAHSARQARQELGNTLKLSGESIQQRLLENIRMQKDQLDSFSKQLVAMARLNEEKLTAMRQTMETQLRTLQEDNSKKLEQMRATVDEKLQSTLDKRLGESFKQVSERLEQVHKGLGRCVPWLPVSAT